MLSKLSRNKSIDFLIIYERKNRELENAILLQSELERRGFVCKIAQFYDGAAFNIFNHNPPGVIVVPHLYDTNEVARVVARFGRPSAIVNLQYEQVLSEKWEKHGHHNPKGLAIYGHHVCWGWKTVDRLHNAGVPRDNLHLLGAIQLDLLRSEFTQPENSRKQLAKEFCLPDAKAWNLFLSSFTYADIEEHRLAMNESVAGTNLSSFVKIHTKSRDEILIWFERILEIDVETIFIYRPHPDELNLEKVLKLQEKFDNFHVISAFAAKVWIEASDKIFSWYSTTIVESHFLDKAYSILRPYELPDYFDSVLLRHGVFVETYSDFKGIYLSSSKVKSKALDSKFIDMYYSTDNAQPSFVLLSDFLVNLLGRSTRLITPNWKLIFKYKIISLAVLLVYWLYCTFSLESIKPLKFKFLANWFKEFKTQIADGQELNSIRKTIDSRIGPS